MTLSPSSYKWCKTRWIRTNMILKWYTNSHVTTIIRQMSCVQGKQNKCWSWLKFQSLPLPLDSTSTTSSPSLCLFNDSSLRGTRVTNLPDYVAISTDERYIIEISVSQMALCHGRPHMISCPDRFPHQVLTEPSCAKAMFFQDRIQELCHFEFQESVIIPSVIELDEGHLLLTHISDLIFTCNRRVLKCPGCTFCMLVVPYFCSLLTGSFSFSPRLAACQERSDVSIVTNPGVNLALLQTF